MIMKQEEWQTYSKMIILPAPYLTHGFHSYIWSAPFEWGQDLWFAFNEQGTVKVMEQAPVEVRCASRFFLLVALKK